MAESRQTESRARESRLTVSRPALLDHGSDDAFRQLVQDMLSMAVRLQAARDRFGAIAGISGPQYSMLIAIAHLQQQEPAVTVSVVAAHLHVSGTYVTAELKKLEGRSLVAKTPNPGDGRSVVLALTESGRRLIDGVRPALRQTNDEIFRDISAEEFAILRRVMARMVPALDDALLIAEAHERRMARADHRPREL